MMVSPWTPERIDRLKSLWLTAKTAKEISLDIFGDPFHRNACIGKARRMGLPNRKSPINPVVWDDQRFIRMWLAPTVTLVHIAHVFKCEPQTVRKHAQDLKLPGRLHASTMHRHEPIAQRSPAITVPAPIGCSKCRCGVFALPGMTKCYTCADRGAYV